jgi:hypothetical protein
MKLPYAIINETCAPVPHFKVVHGPDSFLEGVEIFTVEAGDTPLLVETALEHLVSTANARNTCILATLQDVEVMPSDLPTIAESISNGLVPFLRPLKFGVNDLNRVYSHLFNGGPADLSQFAASMAIKDLIPNWKAALSEGTHISDLVSDVDDVIQHLEAFKALCAEKKPAIDPKFYSGYLKHRREEEAVKAFESYDFGRSVTSIHSDWNLDGDDRWIRKAIGEVDGLESRFAFHVVFAPNSFRIEESLALDLDTGSFF